MSDATTIHIELLTAQLKAKLKEFQLIQSQIVASRGEQELNSMELEEKQQSLNLMEENKRLRESILTM